MDLPEKVPARHPSSPLLSHLLITTALLSFYTSKTYLLPIRTSLQCTQGAKQREIFNIWFKPKPPPSSHIIGLLAFLFWHRFLLRANVVTESGYWGPCWDALYSDISECLDNKANRRIGRVEDSLPISSWQRHCPQFPPLNYHLRIGKWKWWRCQRKRY